MATSREEASVPTLVLKEGEEAAGASVSDDNHTGNSNNNNSKTTGVTIHLSPQEESLIETLLQAVAYLEQGKIPNFEAQTVEIRIAGGWVRDKVLGIPTHDVDIAVDALSGVEFATIVQSYLTLINPNDKRTKIGVIAANPNQSKHLETATMLVMGLDCDFCNLRAQEIYTQDSRIPVTRFGTPLEDAQRRDFCLNALFFNLTTKKVEDWTQRGLNDLLDQKLLVTPLDAFTTLQDDPLRVLRAIRFAIRLDFQLDGTLREASRSSAIHKALLVKVSRERVGKELEGMLSGKGANPHKALALIGDLALSSCVFSLPSNSNHAGVVPIIEGNLLEQPFAAENVPLAWDLSTSLMPHVATIPASASLQQPHPKVQTTLDPRLFALASYLLPFRKLSYLDRKSKQIPVVDFMMRESIKFKNKDVTGMMTLLSNVDAFVTLLHQDDVSAFSRLEVGLLLRRTKDLWVTCLFLAAAAAAVVTTVPAPSSSSSVLLLLAPAQQLYNTIAEMELDLSWKVRPLLDGRALIKALGLPKGPVIGTYLEEQVKWMLEHHDSAADATAEACLEHLVSFQKQLAGTAATATKRNLEVDASKSNEESKRAHVDKK